MRFLICGIGSIGQRHYKNLRSLGHKTAVYRSGKNAGYNTDFLEKFFQEQETTGAPVRTFADFDEAIAAFDPDAVFVTNPNARHTEIALRAAEADRHLFIEKPVAATLDGLETLERLATQKKLTVMVGYNFRFHPLLKKMKELFEAGTIGTAISAHVEMGENIEDWHPWEDYAASYGPWKEKGGGAVLCFSHDIDYLYWFLGMPERILAAGGKMTPLKGDAEDMAKSLWIFPGGTIASVHLDYWQRPPRRTFQLIGTEGTMIWDYNAKNLTLFPHGKDAGNQTWKVPEGFDRNDMFMDEVKEFIGAVERGSDPSIPLREGMDVLNICLDIKRQLRT